VRVISYGYKEICNIAEGFSVVASRAGIFGHAPAFKGLSNKLVNAENA